MYVGFLMHNVLSKNLPLNIACDNVHFFIHEINLYLRKMSRIKFIKFISEEILKSIPCVVFQVFSISSIYI